MLDEQRRNYRLFGEIAMSMGMLTRAQVDALLGIQRLRRATEAAEALASSGIGPIDGVMAELGRFLSQQHLAVSCHEC